MTQTESKIVADVKAGLQAMEVSKGEKKMDKRNCGNQGYEPEAYFPKGKEEKEMEKVVVVKCCETCYWYDAKLGCQEPDFLETGDENCNVNGLRYASWKDGSKKHFVEETIKTEGYPKSIVLNVRTGKVEIKEKEIEKIVELENKVEDAKKKLAYARAEYARGIMVGRDFQKHGRDIGTSSFTWETASEFYRAGYNKGWGKRGIE